jgi:hypothetical protein
VTDVGLSGPANYNAIGGLAINNAGMIVGSAALRSTLFEHHLGLSLRRWRQLAVHRGLQQIHRGFEHQQSSVILATGN